MELNINKCSVLSITLKRISIFHDYITLGAMPKRVTNHNYLGVTISSDLNWLKHVKIFIIRLAEPLVFLKEPYPPAHKVCNLLPTKCLFAPKLNMLVKSGTSIQCNVFRKLNKFIFHEYRRDTDTSHLINRLNLDPLYTRRLIQQATMSYKVHYNLVDICPPSYVQNANHISSRTDHPLMYCNKNLLQINANEYYIFPHRMNIWNRLHCSAVSQLIPSVDNFHMFAMPAIRVMVLLSFKFHINLSSFFI